MYRYPLAMKHNRGLLLAWAATGVSAPTHLALQAIMHIGSFANRRGRAQACP